MRVTLAILAAAAMTQFSTRAATNPIGNTSHNPILGPSWYCEKIKSSDFSLTPDKFDLIAKDPTGEDAMIDVLAAVLNHARKGNNYDAPGLQLEKKSSSQSLIILVSPQGDHAPIINPTDEQTSALAKSIGKSPIYLRFPIDDLGLPIFQFWVEALRNCYGDFAVKNIYTQAGTPLRRRRRPHHTDKAKYGPSIPKHADKQGYQFGFEDSSTDVTSTALLSNAKQSQVTDLFDYIESRIRPPPKNEDPLESADLDESNFQVWAPRNHEELPKYRKKSSASDTVRNSGQSEGWKMSSRFNLNQGYRDFGRNDANEGQSQPQYQSYQQQQPYPSYQQQQPYPSYQQQQPYQSYQRQQPYPSYQQQQPYQSYQQQQPYPPYQRQQPYQSYQQQQPYPPYQRQQPYQSYQQQQPYQSYQQQQYHHQQ
ncbi:hypothetical protein IWQ60_003896 [Tieghemiomyces parasiticus]|uniref:Uncharacterized protein n=1 Tax=Tieghemiomyces parasiticus TaxID=78921 RepID=A0A9W8A9X2_9FUNG|nr:hypothetical protein IWQ60_003896 [Tieghemiomyces parasiticus]